MLPHNPVPQQSYCTAPWVESIVYANGDLKPCCLSVTVLGNWQQEGLANAWKSKRYQDFRKKIINGQFPEDNCRKCYSNKYNRNLAWGLGTPFHAYLTEVNQFFQFEQPEILALASLFSEFPESIPADKWQQVLINFETALNRLRISTIDIPRPIQLAIHKLLVIGTITRSFFEQNLIPPIIAPFREVQLISRCNARCLECVGSYSGSTSEGPTMDDRLIPYAFSNQDDIVNFFHNGSEFLFYNKWKDIAAMLFESGVKISLSTNSILLTPTNIKHLVDNRLLFGVNISIDGATKATVESIRVNVNFDHMMSNLNFLCEYADQQQYTFPISFSFVLMEKNYKELPALVRLVGSFKKKYSRFHFMISLQMLALLDVAGYREFVKTQHPSLVEKGEIVRVFEETLAESRKNEISIDYLGNSLENFIEQGCPIPVLLDPLQLLERGSLSLDGLHIRTGNGWHNAESTPLPARWITKNASILIHSDKAVQRKLHMTIASFHKPRQCQILINSIETFRKSIPLEPEAIFMKMDLPQGETELQILSLDGDDAPNTIEGLHSPDDRPLAFHIRSFEVV